MTKEEHKKHSLFENCQAYIVIVTTSSLVLSNMQWEVHEEICNKLGIEKDNEEIKELLHNLYKSINLPKPPFTGLQIKKYAKILKAKIEGLKKK